MAVIHFSTHKRCFQHREAFHCSYLAASSRCDGGWNENQGRDTSEISCFELNKAE